MLIAVLSCANQYDISLLIGLGVLFSTIVLRCLKLNFIEQLLMLMCFLVWKCSGANVTL